jgi:Tfp pilus assembly protein PilF
MRLGSKDGEAHHAMASLAFHYDRDFVTAEREFKSAIDLNHDAYTYFSYGWLLSQQGRHEEAVNALQQAVELDPRSPAMHTDLGWWLYGSRKYEQAIAEATRHWKFSTSIRKRTGYSLRQNQHWDSTRKPSDHLNDTRPCMAARSIGSEGIYAHWAAINPQRWTPSPTLISI